MRWVEERGLHDGMQGCMDPTCSALWSKKKVTEQNLVNCGGKVDLCYECRSDDIMHQSEYGENVIVLSVT